MSVSIAVFVRYSGILARDRANSFGVGFLGNLNNIFHSFFAFARIYLTVKGSKSKRASKADLSIVGSK